MPPKSSRAKPVVDAPAGGGDPASKSSPGKGKDVIDILPSEAEVTTGGSGLTIEEKPKALASVSLDDTFVEDDSDEELEIDTAKSSYPHLRFTAILLFPVTPSREVASVILTSLLPHVEFASHIMPADPISYHSFVVKVAFRMITRVQLGPCLWRLPAYMVERSGVRKVIEAVERQAAACGVDFKLLISRLNAGLRAYATEEGKMIGATMAHLQREVAVLKQAWLGDPGCARLKELLAERESQLKGYQLARKERTQISELDVGRKLVADNKEILCAAAQYYRDLFGEDRRRTESAWFPAVGRKLSQASMEVVSADWTEKEVKSAFCSMAKGKAPGKDGLPKELFEVHWDVLGKHFMKLVEGFATSASLPTSTKDAVTILLHKKGGRDQLENYRPITLLSFTYKVLARVIADRMKKVLHEVISPEQYGFIPGRRLSDAVGLVTDVIEAAKNEDKDWYLLLVDFRKAFDSVSRGFLFTVLERTGFPERFISWGEEQIAEAERLLEAFEADSGLATNKGKSSILPLGKNLDKQPCRFDGFKWVKSGEAERLLGMWVTPDGCCAPTWEKAFARIKEKLRQWEAQHLTTGARAAVINCYISPIIFFQAQVYPPPMVIWGRILKLTHNFMSGNRATTDKGFILWSHELLYMAREDGGVGVRDPEIALTCLTTRRIGLLLTKTNELKKEIMLQAADLPLGTDTFVPHVKLLKCWRRKSERWKLACGDFMQSSLAETPPERTRGEAELERLVFNRHILLKGKTPVGGQKAAAKLWDFRLKDLVASHGEGGRRSWKELLLSAELLQPPQPPPRPLPQRTPLYSNTQLASLRELKGSWDLVVAVKRAMRMLNPSRQVADLGDLLFGKAASTSAFPEASLSAITVHQIWAERCECVFRGRRFRARRVLRRIEAAFRLHVKVYTRTMGRMLDKGGASTRQKKAYALAGQEEEILGRI
ncbi:unnamed protein product [Closterium sp. Yama58-4]|nr:unnamed protein product [Closterium sp. Yama58-4]